jgi:hypothetical protein
MFTITIVLVNGQSAPCPSYITDHALLALLGRQSVTLGKVEPLKNGDALRSFRYVGAEGKAIDLRGYHDLFCADRQWLGRIINA